MNRLFSRHATARTAALAATFAVALLPVHAALAADPLGLYIGGAVGEAQVATDGASVSSASFKANHSAYKVMVGIRPISLIGVEVAYMDFGNPTGDLAGLPADVKMKGTAAFGVLYLPVPVIDVYAKLGLARLQSTVNGQIRIACIATPCVPPLFQLDRTNSSIAGGAGVQFAMGSVAVRGEYERFNAAGGNPGLWSLGLTWTF